MEEMNHSPMVLESEWYLKEPILSLTPSERDLFMLILFWCHRTGDRGLEIDESTWARLCQRSVPQWRRQFCSIMAAGLVAIDRNGSRLKIEPEMLKIASDQLVPSRSYWSKKHYPQVFERDRNLCRYCAGPGDVIDHVLPRVQQGGDAPDNLVVACSPCNQHKSGRTPEQAGMSLLPVPEAP